MQKTLRQARVAQIRVWAVRLYALLRASLAAVGTGALVVLYLPVERGTPVETPASFALEASEQGDAREAAQAPSEAAPAEGQVTARERRLLTELIAARYRIAREAAADFIAAAYRVALTQQLDPLLVLAVIAVESRFNPVAESVLGAKGLMQVLPKYHRERIDLEGGEAALLDPEANIRIGTGILRDYLRRAGELETALQMYGGNFDDPAAQYARRVLAERARFEQALGRPG